MAKDSAGKATKEEKKAAKQASRAQRRERWSQIWQAFQMQRKEDKLLVPLMVGAIVLTALVFLVVGLLIGQSWFLVPIGVLLGAALAMLLFGRRVQNNVYTKADGQPGAAGWALDNMRGQWRVTQAVAGTTQLDVVHRVIGRPGVVLVAEGASHRTKGLLAQEKKKVSRVAGQVPIYEFTVGNEEGDVPLSKLQRHMTKLPRNIDKDQMETLEKRLTAIAGRGGPAMPKGPAPKGAGMKGMQRTVRRR
ncbi:DUF4191 domain-containing protein [Actinomycetospora endophytica]|uniref:DUF4191 domain-containing protein n=1 Tax=Actinomycetospora endophytica TaxID=2291215 RepID=A0ABS8PE31_9PSEU|nr:DUF4191 domain-containing protein [Actinomycetospora endophytica]MCD2196532.1 DUF4191 domain-containing protein [Actinomycetospora endophytica]